MRGYKNETQQNILLKFGWLAHSFVGLFFFFSSEVITFEFHLFVRY